MKNLYLLPDLINPSPLISFIALLLTFSFLHAGIESEYNSNKYNANAIAENSITTGTIKNGNDDFFKFTPSSDITITIETSNYAKKMSILLMEGCGWNSTDLTSKTSPTNAANVSIDYPVNAGTEYCIDLSVADHSDRPYTLTLSPQAINHDPIAHNKNFSTLKNTSLSNNLITQGGTADSDSDGDTLSTSKLTDPLHGSASVNNDGSFTYTPTTNYPGSDSFTYELSDGNSGTDTATVSINITSNDPIANDKNFNIVSNSVLTANALNDGGTADSDPNGDSISVSGYTNPLYGTLSSGVGANGDFTYTPFVNTFGPDSFDYNISDGTLIANATVYIQVYAVGDEPIPNDDANATEVICASFEDVLQTRSDPSDIHHKSGASADIYDNPDCTLNTGDVDFGSWQHLHCDGGDATASGTYGQSFNINYSNRPDPASINNTPSSSALDETVTVTPSTLASSEYNKVDIGSGSTGSLNVTFSSLQKINTLNLTTDNSIDFTTPEPYNLEIGSVGIVNNGSGNSFTTTTTPKNIKIDTFELPGQTTIDFEASQTIKMENLIVGRASTDVKLKAQYVQINTLNQSNSYGGTSNIEIIADYVDIGTLDLDQEATITFKPYTPGKRILFRANSISASSSSTMIVSSGNYYTPSFSIPGSSNVSSIRALDNTQLINMFIDGNFNPGNDPGINSDGNDGNFGSLPPANFLFFVNGDLTTGGGGTTFNATVYVEGSVDFGSPSYLKGALSSHGDIEIGNNSEFYYDQSIDDAGWGECSSTTPIYQNQYSCGIFGSVLTSYDLISSGAAHPANNDQACYTGTISYPENRLIGEILCNPHGCGGTAACNRTDPPDNKLEYTVSETTKLNTAEGTPSNPLQDLDYGDFNGNFNLTLDPQSTYGTNTPVMRLGDVTLTGANTLTLAPGDYYFQSLTFTKNNPSVVLSGGGSVRIFIQNDFTISKNGLNINASGSPDDLFIYIKGDLEALTNGAIEVWKAFFYVEGTARLNANSNNMAIYGGITAEGPIVIEGNNGNFYQTGDADDLGYGECQMCYTDIYVGGFSFNMGDCPGFSMSFMSNIKVPIESSDALSNASVEEGHISSMFSMSFGSTYKVIDEDGNKVRDADTSSSGFSAGAMGMDMSMFGNKVVSYPLGDNNGNYGPADSSDYNALYSSTMIGFGFCEWRESLAYVAHYDDGDKHYDVLLGQCEEVANPPIPYITGPFDAWDTFRDNASVPPTDRNISTKIVNKAFQLSLASLNKTNDAYETKQGTGDINVSIYPNGSLTPISNSYIFDANTTAHDSSVDFHVTNAAKDARVGFKLCATYEHNATTGKTDYFLYSSASCSAQATLHDCNATTGTPTWHICYSTDNFAIRPYSFRAFGKNQYKLAGEDFNITIKGVDEGNNSINSGTVSDVTGVSGYDANLSNLNITSQFYQPSTADITLMKTHTGETNVTGCPNAGTFTINNSSNLFVNGEVNASLKFSETGILDLNISEKPEHEWALIDADDTNDSDRYIQPATVIFDNTDISKHNLLLFAPYKFDTTAEYNTTNAKNWLYMHDINGSNSSFTTPIMAAFIKYTITAKNKDGDITHNYTRTCFPDTTESTPYNPATDCPQVNGLKMNTTFDLFLDADINSTADANLSLYTEDNNSNAIYVPFKNKSILTGNSSIQEWISPKNFESGVGKATVYFNIDRNTSLALNPIKIGVIDANTSTSWMTNPGSPKEFNGSDVNQSKNFSYGRAHAPRRNRYKGNVGTALIYYEAYCDSSGDRNLLPNATTSKTSIDSVDWFQNEKHNTPNDGNVTNVRQYHSLNDVNSSAPTSAVPAVSTLTYDESSEYPYKTTMEYNASIWLIYNRFDENALTNRFNVEFYKAAGEWTGAHETDTATDSNASGITNNRIIW